MYSNRGYVLLAKVVERVTGQSLREWSEQEIFQPLEMNHTHVHDNVREIVPNVAASYQAMSDGSYLRYADNMAVIGSSALFLTIEDLARWAIRLQDTDDEKTHALKTSEGSNKRYRQGVVHEQIGQVRTQSRRRVGGVRLGDAHPAGPRARGRDTE